MAREKEPLGGYVYVSIWGDGFDPESFRDGFTANPNRGEVRQYRRTPAGTTATGYWMSETRPFCRPGGGMFAEDVLLGLLEDLRPSLPQADGQGIVMSAHIVRYASRISQVQGTFMSRELIRFLDSFGADLDYDIVRPPPADKHSDTANQDRVMLEVGE